MAFVAFKAINKRKMGSAGLPGSGMEKLAGLIAILLLWSSAALPAWGAEGFEDLGNGTVLQRSTGLYWQQGDDGEGRNWCDARRRCARITTGGFDDWRLPTNRELVRVTQERLAEVLERGKSALTPVFHNYYWSSTYLVRDRYHEGPLTIHGTNGESVMADISAYRHTRCVRGEGEDESGNLSISSFIADRYSGMSPFEPRFHVSVQDECGLPRGIGPYRFEFDFGNGFVKTVDSSRGSVIVPGFFQTTGEYEVKVRVYDSAGNDMDSSLKVSVTSDMSSPLAGITLPQDGAVLKEIAQIIAQVQDETSLKEVKIYIDGKSLGYMKETHRNIYEYRLNTYSLKNGSHTITVKALNSLGLLSSSSINITTDNN